MRLDGRAVDRRLRGGEDDRVWWERRRVSDVNGHWRNEDRRRTGHERVHQGVKELVRDLASKQSVSGENEADKLAATHLLALLLGLNLLLRLFHLANKENNLFNLARRPNRPVLEDSRELLERLLAVRPALLGNGLDEPLLDAEVAKDIREVAEERLGVEAVLLGVADLELLLWKGVREV